MRLAKIIIALFVAFCAIANVNALNPGIQSSISTASVQKLVNKVIPPVISSIRGTKFPDMNHSQKKKKAYIYHPTFTSLNVGSFVASVQNNKFTIGLRDFNLELKAGWRVKVKKLIWFSTHGNVSVKFAARSILASFNFGTHNVGGYLKPTVGVASVNVDVQTTKIKLSRNIFAWLVNMITSFMKNKIRSLVQKVVHDSVKGGLVSLAAKITNSIPHSLNIAGLGAINLGLTSGLALTNNRITVAFNGQIGDGNAPRHAVPYAPTGRMLDLLIDTYVFNTASDIAHRKGMLKRTFNNSSRPAGFTHNLVGSLLQLPALDSAGHGNKPITVRIVPASRLDVQSNVGNLALQKDVFIHFDLNIGSTVIEALVIKCTSGGAVNVKFANVAGSPSLQPQLNSLTSKFETVRSAFGPVTFNKLNTLLSDVLNKAIVPLVNTLVLKPVPIPTTVGLTLANPSIQFKKDHVYAGFDVDFKL